MKFQGCDEVFCFSSICKFGSFKYPLAIITSLPELYFRFRRLILVVQTKKKISTNNGSSTRCWKPWTWVRFHLILTMKDIFISSSLNPVIKLTCNRSTEFKDILPRNISQLITKTIPSSTRLLISYAIKQGILFWVCWKVNGD